MSSAFKLYQGVIVVGWNRKQYDKSGGKVRKVLKGEKDWTRDEKEAIRQYQDKYERREREQRKAG